MLEAVFWASFGMVAYAYFGYPTLLVFLSLFRSRNVLKGDITPAVTFIITAYNEEKRIHAKLVNTLNLSYPDGLLEVMVASDCSTDRTDQIVRSFEPKGVKLVRAPKRMGKEGTQKIAVQVAKGEILVFSDVATILPENALRNIVRNFHDPTVGCVSSVDRFIDKNGRVSGEGVYVRYEMGLRALEARVNSLVGLSGSFFAARSIVCKQTWSENLQSDFNTVLNCMRMGLRGVADSDSVGYYEDIADERREFDRKVRTVLRGISVFMHGLVMINPLRYPMFSWQLISHKLCRWLVPFAMLSTLSSNLVLAVSSGWYRATLMLQVLFYSIALGGLLFRSWLRCPMVKLPAFFVLVNASILKAWIQYLSGERLIAWEPSRR